MKRISVIGAGTMGNGIAHVLALKEYQVLIHDIDEDRLNNSLAIITKNLDRQVIKEHITKEEKMIALKSIKKARHINELTEADLVIEAVVEDQELKSSIFKKLDSICKPSTILASNTSSISITQLGTYTQRADKVIGMHFMNPVPLMSLVEVVKGTLTSSLVIDQTCTLARHIEKIPVVVEDQPGFVSNRILMPMINEAIYTLYEGVAGVQEIDTIMKLGMSHPMGPLQLADFIGLDVCLSILNVLHSGFRNSKYAACPLLVGMVKNGQLGKKSGSGFYDWSSDPKSLVVSNQFINQ